MHFSEICAILNSKNRQKLAKCTIVEGWKNNFWIEAAPFIGAGTVYQPDTFSFHCTIPEQCGHKLTPSFLMGATFLHTRCIKEACAIRARISSAAPLQCFKHVRAAIFQLPSLSLKNSFFILDLQAISLSIILHQFCKLRLKELILERGVYI